MNSKRESRVDFILNRLGASKASASLKIFLALVIFGIASALLIYGVHAAADSGERGISFADEKEIAGTGDSGIAIDKTGGDEFKAMAGTCGGTSMCSCGNTLNSSRTLNSSDTLTGCTGNGLDIGANDIVLDCAGNTISGDSIGSGEYGVYISSSYSNVTVKNCKIHGYNMSNGAGIYDNGASDVYLLDNELYNSGSALWATNADNVVFNNTKVYGISDFALLIDNGGGATNFTITDNNITSTGANYCIYISGNGSSGDIKQNTLNCVLPIYMQMSTGANSRTMNITGNNITGSSYRIYMNNASSNKLIYHNNIYGSEASKDIMSIRPGGFMMPDEAVPFEASYNNEGNFWNRSTCPAFNASVDSNNETVVDSHAYIAENGWLTGAVCLACGDAINSSTVLGGNLTNCHANGLNITGSNLVLDCAGYSIIGNNSNGYGVYLNYTVANITIKNCTISGFNTSDKAGIFGYVKVTGSPAGPNNVTVMDSTFYNNYFGIKAKAESLTLPSNWIIFNNNFLSNEYYGIYISGQNHTIQGNTIKNQIYYGIYSYYGGNYVIRDNVINNTITFQGIVMIAETVGSDIIQNNSVAYSGYRGININSDYSNHLVITDNNITNNVYQGLYLGNVSDKLVYHNNIYDNSITTGGIQVSADDAIELSNGTDGNYWGNTGCPAFIPGTDSNAENVTDNFAYDSVSGWEAGTPPDCINVTINSVDLTPDMFACNITGHTGNSIVHVVVNATDVGTGVSTVDANIDDLGLSASLSNTGGDIWEGDIDVTDTSDYDFGNGAVNVTINATDVAGNGYYLWGYGGDMEPFTTLILYNMTQTDFGDPLCIQAGPDATSFCDINNFSDVNYVHDIEINGSADCFYPIELPWGNTFKNVITLNFSSVDFSDPETGAKMGAIGEAIIPYITMPGEFGDSYIYVNTTAFAELDTNTTIKMIGLPFGAEPDVFGPGTVSGILWEQDAEPYFYHGISVPKGNITFTVNGFSQYNIKDDAAPIVDITRPGGFLYGTVGGNFTLNVTVNGTGTILSSIVAKIGTTTLFSYNKTQIQSICHNLTENWDYVYCEYNATRQTSGSKTITVTANDYGGLSPGNRGNDSVIFTVDATAPTITEIYVNDITNVSETIHATTNENATCFAQLGTDTSYGFDTGTSTGIGWHNHGLSGFTSAATLYHYRWNCTDNYNNSAVSSDYTFITANYQSGEINNTTTTNMTFNFTENDTNVTKVGLEISLNETVNATVDVGLSNNATELFSISGYEGLGTYYTIESDNINGTNIEWVILKLYYNEDDLPNGVEESALRLYWYNTATSNWEEIPGGVNETENYVWGNSTHFSEYTIAGAKTTTGTTGGSLGGGLPPGGVNYTLNLDSEVLKNFTNLKVNDKITFTWNGEQHLFNIISLNADHIVVEIASTPARYTLQLNTPTAIDVDGDGKADIEITLTKIYNGVASVEFEKISGATVTPAAPETATATTTTEQPGTTVVPISGTSAAAAKNDGIYFLVFLALVGIVAVVYYVFLKKKK